MRVIVFIKADKDSEAGVMPSRELLVAMGDYNEKLMKAGVLLAGEGLHPSAKGKRVRFSGEKRTVEDGPFSNTNDLVAGYWLWRVESMEDAVDWVSRMPNPSGVEAEVEIRPVFEADDFGTEFTSELRQKEHNLRNQLQRKP